MGVRDAQVLTLVKWISAWTRAPGCNIHSCGTPAAEAAVQLEKNP